MLWLRNKCKNTMQRGVSLIYKVVVYAYTFFDNVYIIIISRKSFHMTFEMKLLRYTHFSQTYKIKTGIMTHILKTSNRLRTKIERTKFISISIKYKTILLVLVYCLSFFSRIYSWYHYRKYDTSLISSSHAMNYD